jgi:hypothetical protein
MRERAEERARKWRFKMNGEVGEKRRAVGV